MLLKYTEVIKGHCPDKQDAARGRNPRREGVGSPFPAAAAFGASAGQKSAGGRFGPLPPVRPAHPDSVCTVYRRPAPCGAEQ